MFLHDDVIKWKHFPLYWPFVRGIHRSPVNSPHKGQWRGALMFSLICGWINSWVNDQEVGELRRHHAHYDITVMFCSPPRTPSKGPDILEQRVMMTSSNGNIFCITGFWCGEFTGEFPAQRPVTRDFNVLFGLHMNKRLSKQSWGWLFETPSRPLGGHRNVSNGYQGPLSISDYNLRK